MPSSWQHISRITSWGRPDKEKELLLAMVKILRLIQVKGIAADVKVGLLSGGEGVTYIFDSA